MDISKLLNKILPGDKTAREGIVWSIGGFGLIGVTGISLNFLIGAYYHPDALGVYNQLLSFYVVLGQLGAFGLQNAIIYYIAKLKDKADAGRLLTAYCMLSSGISLCISIILFTQGQFIGESVFNSPELGAAIVKLSPATFLLSINKILLGCINGLRYMRAFAVFQVLRYLLIISFIIGMIFLSYSSEFIPYALVFAETVIVIGQLIFLMTHIRFKAPQSGMFTSGLKFGGRSVIGGIIGEFNTKADVVILGIFLSDYIVGLYSFAAMIAEGYFAMLSVFRVNYNPMFAKFITEKNFSALSSLRRQITKKVLPFGIGIAIALEGAFLALCYFMPESDYFLAAFPLALILGAMAAASPSIARGNLLTYGGNPGLDTMITAITVAGNCALNLIFVPMFGMVGAASATAASYLIFSLLTYIFIRRRYGKA